MKIAVCIRQDLNGEISPFDACAYEAALRIENAEVTLISMGAPKTEEFLKKMTRLSAQNAILLSDPAFAGADTLATAYTLSLAIKKIKPDLILCGRQTLIGDTGQVPPMMSVFCDCDIISSAMDIAIEGTNVICHTRDGEKETKPLPCIVTVERINNLRLPSIRSKMKEVSVFDAKTLGADISKCGLEGSPTRVLKTFENASGKRKCKFIEFSDLEKVVKEALSKSRNIKDEKNEIEKLSKVCILGKAPYDFAKLICDNIIEIKAADEDTVICEINKHSPDAVLFASDSKSKAIAAKVSARLSLGLCADCTALDTEDGSLIMYRPALSGSIIAKIKSLTLPAMASVRTMSENTGDIIIALGYGAKDSIDKAKELCKSLGGELASSRKAVDSGFLPYDMQVGLTGKTVAPPVYIAIGVSGAVHHIAGMQRSGTVIAINPDKNAPIFEYADFGILAEF